MKKKTIFKKSENLKKSTEDFLLLKINDRSYFSKMPTKSETISKQKIFYTKVAFRILMSKRENAINGNIKIENVVEENFGQ